MTHDMGEWDYQKNNLEVWFEHLEHNRNYRFLIVDWHTQLNAQKNIHTDYIKVNVVSLEDCKVKGNSIIKGSCMVLSLWKSFFDKWERCIKPKLDKDKPIEINLFKYSNRKWHVTKIQNRIGDR